MSEDWMDEANKRLGDTSVFALWEEQVRKAKEHLALAWGFGSDCEWQVYSGSVQCAPGFEPYVIGRDEGAGCSDEGEWVPVPRADGLSARVDIAGQWSDFRFRLPFELPSDQREMRRLVSEKLQGVGDAIMAAWEKQYGGS